MNLSFDCPHCDRPARVEIADEASSVDCPECKAAFRFPEGAYAHSRVNRCLVCPSTDLFLRKDFPQRLGVAIVAFGIISSTIAYYFGRIYLTFGLLFLSAAIDFLLYEIVGHALVCYRCMAHYRGLAGLESAGPEGHEPFSLETHERYRQQAARLAGRPTGQWTGGSGQPR